jgi:hypothetical protein
MMTCVTMSQNLHSVLTGLSDAIFHVRKCRTDVNKLIFVVYIQRYEEIHEDNYNCKIWQKSLKYMTRACGTNAPRISTVAGTNIIP